MQKYYVHLQVHIVCSSGGMHFPFPFIRFTQTKTDISSCHRNHTHSFSLSRSLSISFSYQFCVYDSLATTLIKTMQTKPDNKFSLLSLFAHSSPIFWLARFWAVSDLYCGRCISSYLSHSSSTFAGLAFYSVLRVCDRFISYIFISRDWLSPVW